VPRCRSRRGGHAFRAGAGFPWPSFLPLSRYEYQPNGGCSHYGADVTFGPMNEISIPAAFLSALSSRDFGRLAACLAPSAQARMLLPRGPEVRSGRDEIAHRIEGWFAAGSDFAVLETHHEMVGLRHRLTWRFRMRRNNQAPEIVEQVAFVNVAPDGISEIDLLCSGFLWEVEPAAFGGDEAAVMCATDAGHVATKRGTTTSQSHSRGV
jgi:hypothetical protein